MGIEKVRANFAIAVHWKAFPLHPEIPAEGLLLKEVYATLGVDSAQAAARVKKVAAGLGLPLAEREKTYNSRLAQELGKWAEEKGKGDAFHDALFKAYFAEAKNISDPAVLAEIVKALGLPEKEAREAMEQGIYRTAVDADWRLAAQLEITCVPTFVFANDAIEGLQPYEALERFLLEKGVKRVKRGA